MRMGKNAEAEDTIAKHKFLQLWAHYKMARLDCRPPLLVHCCTNGAGEQSTYMTTTENFLMKC